MQSRGPPPPHGTTPSPPTDRPHSTHSSVPSSFHTPESVPPTSSSPFFTMNPLTDQRLTGSMMPFHPVDHHHALPRYAHIWCPSIRRRLPIISVLQLTIPSQHIHLPRYRFMALRHVVGRPRAGRRCLFRASVLDLIEPPWHGLSKQRGQYIRVSIAAPESSSTFPQHLSWCQSSVSATAQTSPSHIIVINFIYTHTFCVLIGVLLVPSLLHRPRVMHTRRPCNSVAGALT